MAAMREIKARAQQVGDGEVERADLRKDDRSMRKRYTERKAER